MLETQRLFDTVRGSKIQKKDIPACCIINKGCVVCSKKGVCNISHLCGFTDFGRIKTLHDLKYGDR